MGYVLTMPRGLGGSGQAATQTIGTVSAIGAPIAAPAISGAVGASAALGALAVPIIGAALAGITIGVMELIKNSGCGPTCIQATQYANQAGTLLTQNLDAYMALPTPRAQSAQTQALANFDAIWAKLQQMCGDPSLGAAGKRCITARQAGSCAYHVAPGGGWQQQNGHWTFVPYGPNNSGPACWNWFVGLRDPIANDPYVVPDAQATPATGGAAALSSLTSNPWILALVAAGVIGAIWLI